jgi:hypothetical protein
LRERLINDPKELVVQIHEDDNRSEIISVEVQNKILAPELSLVSEEDFSEIADSDDSSFTNPRVRISGKKPQQEQDAFTKQYRLLDVEKHEP